jgi:uncharacterized protein (DUF1330 family)
MRCENAVFPTPEQLASFFAEPESGPFVMVNLLKFKQKAIYPDGSYAHLSGAEAYQRYAVEVTKLLHRHGGRVRAAGTVEGLMIGACSPLWDSIALAEYPSLAAFKEMILSNEYRAIEIHRNAGLDGQLNIKIKPFPV